MIKINCDLCGKTTESLAKAVIEGVKLDVCTECSKFGKVIAIKRPSAKEQIKQIAKQQEKEERLELLVENYGEIIKKKREAIGLTQKEFASRINEKESTMHKIESGALEPSLHLAKKLEKALGIKLIEQHEEKYESLKKNRIEGFTLGDFINVRK